jgi:hypothetical protein
LTAAVIALLYAGTAPHRVGIAARNPGCYNRSDQLPQGAARLPYAPRDPLSAVVDAAGHHLLAILSNQGSLMGMERFAKRHRKTLNALLGTQIAKPPSDSTFRLLLAQLEVEGFESLLQDWVRAQIGEAEPVGRWVLSNDFVCWICCQGTWVGG